MRTAPTSIRPPPGNAAMHRRHAADTPALYSPSPSLLCASRPKAISASGRVAHLRAAKVGARFLLVHEMRQPAADRQKPTNRRPYHVVTFSLLHPASPLTSASLVSMITRYTSIRPPPGNAAMHRRHGPKPPAQDSPRPSRLCASRPKTINTPGCRPRPPTAALGRPGARICEGAQNLRAQT